MLNSNGDNENSNKRHVTDRYNLVYILFYTLGALTNMPATFLVTANDYWMYKFRDPKVPWNVSSLDKKTDLQVEFSSDFTIVSNVTGILAVILALLLGKKIPPQYRIMGSLCIMIVFFGITIVFVKINTDSWQRVFFGFTMALAVLLNVATNTFMVTAFTIVSKFPALYMATILSGQSICGIFASIVQIISLSLGAAPANNAIFYFTIGAACVLLTLAIFIKVNNTSEFYRYHLELQEGTETPIRKKINFPIFKSTLSKIKYYLLALLVLMGSSVMVNPGVTSLVQSVDKGNGNKWNDVYFVAVTTFLLFHTFDFLGRELAPLLRTPKNGLLIFLASIVRVGAIPMLMYCNIQPRQHLPVAFNSDTVYIILIIIFSLTNGYLVNLCIITIPSLISTEEKVMSSLLVVVTIILSIGTCSFLSILLVKML